MKPAIGAVFRNPRGRTYEVIGHMLDPQTVIVRDQRTSMCDVAHWALMTPDNGWHKLETS